MDRNVHTVWRLVHSPGTSTATELAIGVPAEDFVDPHNMRGRSRAEAGSCAVEKGPPDDLADWDGYIHRACRHRTADSACF